VPARRARPPCTPPRPGLRARTRRGRAGRPRGGPAPPGRGASETVGQAGAVGAPGARRQVEEDLQRGARPDPGQPRRAHVELARVGRDLQARSVDGAPDVRPGVPAGVVPGQPVHRLGPDREEGAPSGRAEPLVRRAHGHVPPCGVDVPPAGRLGGVADREGTDRPRRVLDGLDVRHPPVGGLGKREGHHRRTVGPDGVGELVQRHGDRAHASPRLELERTGHRGELAGHGEDERPVRQGHRHLGNHHRRLRAERDPARRHPDQACVQRP
jgi:hypothetical protein